MKLSSISIIFFFCYPAGAISIAVWSRHDFILRYVRNLSNVWNFVLSAPDTNSFVAMGFSTTGQMVGSSAVVGWVSADGSGTVKQYFLGGQRPNLVVADQGNLTIAENSTSITSRSSRVYLAFQLNTSQPLSRVLYSVGQIGVIPSAPGFALAEHRDKVSTLLNYRTGTSASDSQHSRLRKSHGILNMLSWGILMIIGAMAGRYFKQWDPMWFYSHAAIQSCAFLLGLAGIISGFVLENRLNAEVDTHKALGILILVLGCLQAMAVFARPGKESKVRKYWNWYHHNGGRIVILIAIANVFYGIHLGEDNGTSWNAAYAVVISILFLLSIILEVKLWRQN